MARFVQFTCNVFDTLPYPAYFTLSGITGPTFVDEHLGKICAFKVGRNEICPEQRAGGEVAVPQPFRLINFAPQGL